MPHRTHRPTKQRRSARHRLLQGLGHATLYAASATLAGALVHELLRLAPLSSC